VAGVAAVPPPGAIGLAIIVGGAMSTLFVRRWVVFVATAVALLSLLFSAIKGTNQSVKSSGSFHSLWNWMALFLNVCTRPASIAVALGLAFKQPINA
jgi:ABC-type multidrug transport system permease subunit